MERSKYPRTMHLPWSLGKTEDDKTLDNVKIFHKKEIVVTEKMDGENTTLYADGYLHARSIDGKNHESRDWLKADWASKFWKYNKRYRYIGENMYAKHSIEYNNLESYFYLFAVCDDTHFMNWKFVKKAAREMGYPTPKVLYEGVFNQTRLKKLAKNLPDNVEGYVIRLQDEFRIEDFSKSVAKYVRENHVQTDNHWMHQKIIQNKLKDV